MYSRCPGSKQPRSRRLIIAPAVIGLCARVAGGADGPLRVCADPNNLPFSDRAEAGFENALAELVAESLGRDGVAYTWHPQRRGFIRNTLGAHACDLVIGVPVDYELAATTQPYYYSTYVFVTRTDANFEIHGMDDPDLRELRVGVHAVGDDYASTPGAAALGRRGVIDNVVGYSIYGDYSKPHPPSRLIEAVAAGDVDVAIAWGPLAGYFSTRQAVPLEVTPIGARFDTPDVPFVFGIAMAVRNDDETLRAQINGVISSRAAEIEQLLERFGVPLVAAGQREGKP